MVSHVAVTANSTQKYTLENSTQATQATPYDISAVSLFCFGGQPPCLKSEGNVASGDQVQFVSGQPLGCYH